MQNSNVQIHAHIYINVSISVYINTHNIIFREGKNMEKFKDEIDEAFEEYVEFMYDSENICKCENCPENIGCDSWGGNLPCGQQRCWVTCHCESLES